MKSSSPSNHMLGPATFGTLALSFLLLWCSCTSDALPLEEVGLGEKLSDQGIASLDMRRQETDFSYQPADLTNACGTDTSDLFSPRFWNQFAGCEGLKHGVSDQFSDELAPFKELSSLKYLGGRLIFSHNDFATEIKGLDQLREVHKKAALNRLYLMKNFQSLRNLQYVGEELQLSNMPELESFDGFQNLKVIGGLNLLELPKIKSFDAFQNLRIVEGDLKIQDCKEISQEEIDKFLKRVKVTGQVMVIPQ